MRYLSPSATNNSSLEGVLSSKEQDLLSAYDPTRQVFVSVLRDGHVTFYVIDGDITPPDAWKMKQAEQNSHGRVAPRSDLLLKTSEDTPDGHFDAIWRTYRTVLVH